MKLALVSDIHLEFGNIDIRNQERADVLILSGDICTARDLVKDNSHHQRTVDFWHTVNSEYPDTVYVMGNHEHYGSDYRRTQATIQDFFDRNNLHNIHLLEKSHITLHGYLFVGGTLWTDYNRGDPLTLQYASMSMNDYCAIKDSGRPNYKLYPTLIHSDHVACKNYILDTLENNPDTPTVVVGHHAPTHLSIAPQYQNDRHTNGLFVSDLSDMILDHPQIVLWTHGHTHDPFDYVVGDTRVVCNPRGYARHEQRALDWQMIYIDLEETKCLNTQ